MPYLSTVAAFGFPDFNPPTLLPLYRMLGCRGCQFYRNPKNPPVLAEARRIAEDAGLPVDSIHGLFGPDLDPSSLDPQVRKTTIETYRSEGEVARQLGGWGVVVHPAPTMTEGVSVSPQERQQRQAPLRDTIAQLAAIGAELEVVYLFENVPDTSYTGNDPIGLAAILRELDHPNAKMCFDTGHAHMTCDTAVAARACHDVIRYLHVHDNDSVNDSHEIPGQGTINWTAQAEALATLPAEVPAMLELFKSEAEIRQQIDAGLYDQLRVWLGLS